VLANWPLERLVGFWLGMIVIFGIIYWLAGIGMGWGLQAGSVEVHPDLSGFATAMYFSFVTALSIGYGDVIPVGPLRILAVSEGIAGLLVFGCVISKLVSRRQEELTAEIHRTTFEDRLDRVRTNLHLVFSDLGSVQQLQAEQGALPQQVLRRLESTVRVFRGELQTIHDLLYKSHIEPDEDTLESILANLLICLQSLVELSESCPEENDESANLDAALHGIGNLAKEICGECVPRVYAPALKGAMDQIQSLAERLAQ
jgi:potassium channel LctB